MISQLFLEFFIALDCNAACNNFKRAINFYGNVIFRRRMNFGAMWEYFCYLFSANAAELLDMMEST